MMTANAAIQAGFFGVSLAYCGRCGRELTNPLSVERGIGPICWSKIEENGGNGMDEFWTEELPVAAGLSLKLHTSQESYFGTESRLERDYLAHDAGKKTYVMGQPVMPGRGAAGRAGNAQAWFYPADGVLVLWECYLYEHVRESQRPVEDGLHVATWRAFESEMINRFRPAEVVCPAWEPVYETADWQAFLEGEGYAIEEKKGLAVKRLTGRYEPPTVLASSADEGQDCGGLL